MCDKLPYKSTGAIHCDPENDIHLYVIQNNNRESEINTIERFIRIKTEMLNECRNMPCRRRLLNDLSRLYDEADTLKR